MARLRKISKWLIALAALLVVAQFGVHYLFRSHRMSAYLIAHLQKSFGRPVEAQSFSMQLLPIPRVDVEGVTIGENPAFGNEYFLRADRLTASVRWMSLLAGHFDFGTISLTRPSLILVRDDRGHWNLEGWLPPPTQPSGSTPSARSGNPSTPSPAIPPANHLQKIEFDEGRISFKAGDDKLPFAFTSVSGSVEQTAPGRWHLEIKAEPWRSGVPLQSTGTLRVRGEVAGTSSRLQPANLHLHWDRASVADLFRMITGSDSRVRGAFALDADASIASSADSASPASIWKFALHARATGLHRSDLTERADNPAVNLHLQGLWDLANQEARADDAVLELPNSRLEGASTLRTAPPFSWSMNVRNAGLQARDLLAWYRAFQPGVDDSVSVTQFFQAKFALRGWPIAWEDVRISSDGGQLRLPGFDTPVSVGAVRGEAHNDRFDLQPVTLRFDSPAKRNTLKPEKLAPASSSSNQLDVRLQDDLAAGKGTLRFNGKVSDAADVFRAAVSLGRQLNHGWELSGPASGAIVREWDHGFRNARWSGSLNLDNAQLQAAGMNLPLQLRDAHLEWKPGRRAATITKAEAFGATWSGTIEQTAFPAGPSAANPTAPPWNFQLHADRLDAAELDRWFGPRARPGWLQRLLPSLLGNSGESSANNNPPTLKPSELLQQVSAEGELTADSISVEKIKLAHARAHVGFRDLRLELREASADWAGGSVRGELDASFAAPPRYEIRAQIERANISQFPWATGWADRWTGAASGNLRLATSGVGRDALLAQLDGSGTLQLKNVELRGWDIPASIDSGALRTGASHWSSGTGEFLIRERRLQVNSVTLDSPRGSVSMTGSFKFSQDLDLAFSAVDARKAKRPAKPSAGSRVFQLHGSLEKPVAVVEPLNLAASAAP